MAAKGDIKQILAQAKPKTVTVRVCLRGDLLARHEQLEVDLARAREFDATSNEHDTAPAIAKKIEALEAELTKNETAFTFGAIGQKAWRLLLDKHGPSTQDRAEGYEFDPVTFPVAAIAASAVDPEMSEDDTDRLYELLNFGQWQMLWSACLAANVEGTSVPFSNAASVTLRGYEMKSDSPTDTESDEASS